MTDNTNKASSDLGIIDHHILHDRIANEITVMHSSALDTQITLGELARSDDIDAVTSMKLQKLDLMSQVLDDLTKLLRFIAMDRYDRNLYCHDLEDAINLTVLRRRLIGIELFLSEKDSSSGSFTLL